MRPDDLSSLGIQAMEQSHNTDRVYPVRQNKRRRVRSRSVFHLHLGGECCGVAVLPESLSCLRVQRDNNIVRLGHIPASRCATIHRIELSSLYRDPRITIPKRAVPQLARTAGGPGVCETLDLRGEVAVGTAPLRPCRTY